MDNVASGNRLAVTGLPRIRAVLASHFTQPLVKILARTSITPSALTWIGFVLAVGAMVLIVRNHLFAAGFVVLLGGLFDMLDGALARHTQRATRFGAVLDSVLDRFSEAALLIGALVYFIQKPEVAGVLLVAVALFLSQAVSYIRSRAEAMGLECKVGIFTRPERVVVLALGLLLSGFDYALAVAIAIIAVFSFVTVVQRVMCVWKQTRLP